MPAMLQMSLPYSENLKINK